MKNKIMVFVMMCALMLASFGRVPVKAATMTVDGFSYDKETYTVTNGNGKTTKLSDDTIAKIQAGYNYSVSVGAVSFSSNTPATWKVEVVMYTSPALAVGNNDIVPVNSALEILPNAGYELYYQSYKDDGGTTWDAKSGSCTPNAGGYLWYDGETIKEKDYCKVIYATTDVHKFEYEYQANALNIKDTGELYYDYVATSGGSTGGSAGSNELVTEGLPRIADVCVAVSMMYPEVGGMGQAVLAMANGVGVIVWEVAYDNAGMAWYKCTTNHNGTAYEGYVKFTDLVVGASLPTVGDPDATPAPDAPDIDEVEISGLQGLVDTLNNLVELVGVVPKMIASVFGFLPAWCLATVGLGFAFMGVYLVVKLIRG